MKREGNVKRFTKTFLEECFVYVPETGELIWRHRPIYHFNEIGAQKRFNTLYAGKTAGHPDARKYVRVGLCEYLVRAHSICWVLGTGDYPQNQIDHINGLGHDNRLANLRDVTSSTNHKNARMRKNNTTGVVGVSPRKDGFVAQVVVDGVRQIKVFKSFDEAIGWRKQMEVLDGEYTARHGVLQ